MYLFGLAYTSTARRHTWLVPQPESVQPVDSSTPHGRKRGVDAALLCATDAFLHPLRVGQLRHGDRLTANDCRQRINSLAPLFLFLAPPAPTNTAPLSSHSLDLCCFVYSGSIRFFSNGRCLGTWMESPPKRGMPAEAAYRIHHQPERRRVMHHGSCPAEEKRRAAAQARTYAAMAGYGALQKMELCWQENGMCVCLKAVLNPVAACFLFPPSFLLLRCLATLFGRCRLYLRTAAG